MLCVTFSIFFLLLRTKNTRQEYGPNVSCESLEKRQRNAKVPLPKRFFEWSEGLLYSSYLWPGDVLL